jgi:hypothetical protein
MEGSGQLYISAPPPTVHLKKEIVALRNGSLNGLRAVLDTVKKRKLSCLFSGIKPRSLGRTADISVTILTELSNLTNTV